MPKFASNYNLHLGWDKDSNGPKFRATFDDTRRKYVTDVADKDVAEFKKLADGYGVTQVDD